jgi:hypothetical protein
MRTPVKPPATRPDTPNNELAFVVEIAVLSVQICTDSHMKYTFRLRISRHRAKSYLLQHQQSPTVGQGL